MVKLVFATNNADKYAEIKEIMVDFPVRVYSMKEAGIDMDIEETGVTFVENAIIKAKAVHAVIPEALVVADDSGLAIDYLDGEPGVYSARYLGVDTSYRVKNASLIDRLKGVPEEERTARFVCAIAAILPSGELITCEGTMEGLIDYRESGDNGFGYDPIFFLPEHGLTSAALLPEEKNKISHRGKALRMLREKLDETGIFA
ncbi:MAG: RdgB/HAM1 family non-canonical purine NTP pyrophosphatase [Lachnospiraceae bacterium]|jgi:XTP/dITP diphosphohydrolase|nr:RdgB/HAM1 family non-canonical purine NTP pyrophosphatase [Lachnospiraceae bacterium]